MSFDPEAHRKEHLEAAIKDAEEWLYYSADGGTSCTSEVAWTVALLLEIRRLERNINAAKNAYLSHDVFVHGPKTHNEIEMFRILTRE